MTWLLFMRPVFLLLLVAAAAVVVWSAVARGGDD
jgi:hypothetical protein